MNAVEIEAAVSDLAAQPFNAAEFPYAFLRAFGNKDTTISRLKSPKYNKSDLGGVLQTNNIHIAVAAEGDVGATLARLKESPATTKAKAQFILATDGIDFEAEDLESGETVACAYSAFPDHFGFFLPLAGITTVKQIRESAFDIRATSRLNRLYVELLKDNPEWGTAERRHDMNHFMARLIFCYFAEDTDIFASKGLFTKTIEQMSERSSSNTHEVISEVFRAMNTKHEEREAARIPRWALAFPYVNGGLFAGSVDVPVFSRIARSYLIHIGGLEWTRINPDIFGSMIQAVADDEERGALGMHYTSVPNILKVLNPLFLDDLRARLEEAGTNPRMLLNLRKRIARIRVFDPACGSGNFLVIAYKQLREIENTINERRSEKGRRSDIPLTNFRGIEIRDFAAEIARLALIIAEFQSDVLYRGQQEALKEFLPLDSENWIVCGNALRIDWLSVCPPAGSNVRLVGDDLFSTPLDQSEIDFANAGGETYLCSNPPYLGFTWQTAEQKLEIRHLMAGRTSSSGFLDYVAGWFLKAAEYSAGTEASMAFVATNSICQGQSVSILWPVLLDLGLSIHFAYTSFKWSNLATNKAGVTVVVIGLSNKATGVRRLYEHVDGGIVIREGSAISPYLILVPPIVVGKQANPISDLPLMEFGNKPSDGGHLLLDRTEVRALQLNFDQERRFIRRIFGSDDFIRAVPRYCLWIEDQFLDEAESIAAIRARVDAVREVRLKSPDKGANALARRAHQLKLMRIGESHVIVIPSVSSEARPFLPVGLSDRNTTLTNLAFGIYDGPLWALAVVASRLQLTWIATVCGKLKTDYRYSNTLGWNTFPIPPLTEKNKADLTRCAEDILLARESHFPATIADLYDPDTMPADLRAAHERNDEILERIYIGRRFRNDTERLEKLFELYTKMTAGKSATRRKAR